MWRSLSTSHALSEVAAGSGSIIDAPEDVGGYPVIRSETGYADDDHDGMANVWEIARGFDPADAADGSLDRDGDGFTNVEEFLNGTVP